MKVQVSTSDVVPAIPRTEPIKEMISVSKMDDGRTKVRINSSSLDVIQTCMRKAFYSLHERYISEVEPASTLFGSGIHKALEVFYSTPPEQRKLPEYKDMELMSFGVRVPGDESDALLLATKAFLTKTEFLKSLPEDDKRSQQNGVYILHNYFSTYLGDPYITYRDENGPFVERQFSFILFEDETVVIEYFGTIDLAIVHKETQQLLIADHKTSSRVGTEFYNRLKPNAQYTGYLLAAIRAFGLSPSGFLVNCVEVKAKPKTPRGSAPHFPRQITTRDDFDYEEFTEQVRYAVVNYVLASQSNTWPLGPVNACAMYAGCSFLSVCSSPKVIRENVLNSKFIKGGINAETK